jgi:hypothetical protein
VRTRVWCLTNADELDCLRSICIFLRRALSRKFRTQRNYSCRKSVCLISPGERKGKRAVWRHLKCKNQAVLVKTITRCSLLKKNGSQRLQKLRHLSSAATQQLQRRRNASVVGADVVVARCSPPAPPPRLQRISDVTECQFD